MSKWILIALVAFLCGVAVTAFARSARAQNEQPVRAKFDDYVLLGVDGTKSLLMHKDAGYVYHLDWSNPSQPLWRYQGMFLGAREPLLQPSEEEKHAIAEKAKFATTRAEWDLKRLREAIPALVPDAISVDRFPVASEAILGIRLGEPLAEAVERLGAEKFEGARTTGKDGYFQTRYQAEYPIDLEICCGRIYSLTLPRITASEELAFFAALEERFGALQHELSEPENPLKSNREVNQYLTIGGARILVAGRATGRGHFPGRLRFEYEGLLGAMHEHIAAESAARAKQEEAASVERARRAALGK